MILSIIIIVICIAICVGINLIRNRRGNIKNISTDIALGICIGIVVSLLVIPGIALYRGSPDNKVYIESHPVISIQNLSDDKFLIGYTDDHMTINSIVVNRFNITKNIDEDYDPTIDVYISTLRNEWYYPLIWIGDIYDDKFAIITAPTEFYTLSH